MAAKHVGGGRCPGSESVLQERSHGLHSPQSSSKNRASGIFK